MKNGKQLEYRFPRDVNGKFDIQQGVLNEAGFEYHMKYEKEARFMTSCCLDIMPNGDVKLDSEGNRVGICLPLLEYTETKIVSNSEWVKTFRQVQLAPKTMKNGLPWVISQRENNVVYPGDPPFFLKVIGKRGKEVLLELKVDMSLLCPS